MITGVVLKMAAPKLPLSSAINIAKSLSSICPLYGINNNDILEDFLSNCIHECGDFTTFKEGLNYEASAIVDLFGRHRISVADAYKYGRIEGKQKANQEMIANILYGGAWGLKNLGNRQQGDGWMFRGSGCMQLTGRGMVTKFATYYNAKHGTSFTPEQMAELLRTNIEIGIHGACWIFAIEKKLIDEAVADKLIEIRKKINGGKFGLGKVTVLTGKLRTLLSSKLNIAA